MVGQRAVRSDKTATRESQKAGEESADAPKVAKQVHRRHCGWRHGSKIFGTRSISGIKDEAALGNATAIY